MDDDSKYDDVVLLEDSTTENLIEMQCLEQAQTNTCEKATQALNIPELHDLILLHLDMKTLLFSQRVSKRWQDAIVSSRKLQQKLFFVTVKSFEEAKSLSMVQNEDMVVSWTSDPQISNDIALLNPLFLKSEHREARPSYTSFYLPENIVQDTLSVRSCTGSYKRMLVCQPARDSVTLSIPTYTIRGSRTDWWTAVISQQNAGTLNTTRRRLCAKFSSAGEAALGSILYSIERQVSGKCLVWARALVLIGERAAPYADMLKVAAEGNSGGEGPPKRALGRGCCMVL